MLIDIDIKCQAQDLSIEDEFRDTLFLSFATQIGTLNQKEYILRGFTREQVEALRDGCDKVLSRLNKIDAEKYLKRAIQHFKTQYGMQAADASSEAFFSEDGSAVAVLRNVNGVLAEYRYDVDTNKLASVVTYDSDGTVLPSCKEAIASLDKMARNR